jgi:hypothetical protein
MSMPNWKSLFLLPAVTGAAILAGYALVQIAFAHPISVKIDDLTGPLIICRGDAGTRTSPASTP